MYGNKNYMRDDFGKINCETRTTVEKLAKFLTKTAL